MLKEEPESNKIGSLYKHEKELKRLLESSVHDLSTVPEKERRLELLEERVGKGIQHLTHILHRPAWKDGQEDGVSTCRETCLDSFFS